MKNSLCKKIINYYNYNRTPIWGTIILFLISVIWLSNSIAEVPIMDFWRYINDLTEKVFMGEFSFNDMWSTMGGHREGFAYLMIAFNIRYLKLNLNLWTYLGSFVTLVTCVAIYAYYNKSVIIGDIKIDKVKKILFLFFPFILFSFNQWEIYTLPFAFSFTLRRLFYLIMFFLIEKIILDYDSVKKYNFEIVVFLLFLVLFISGGYLPALIGAIVFCFLLDSVLNYKDRKYIPKRYIILTLIMMIGLIIYTIGLSGINENGQEIKNMFSLDLFKGIFIMLGSSIVDTLFADRYGINLVLFIGIIVSLIYLISLILFFHKKMWRYTYLPILLIVYSGINILVIYFARAGIYGIGYLISSRYSCETICGIIGIVYILIYTFIDEYSNLEKNKFIDVTRLIGLTLIFLILSASYSAEYAFSSNRKEYMKNLIVMMKNIEDYTDEDLEVFQANDPVMVRNGIKLMKKYNLGIFKYENNEVSSNNIGYKTTDFKKIYGIWDDSWIAPKSKFKIETKEKGMVICRGYYPYNITEGLTGNIYINGTPTKFTIDNNNFIIEVMAEKNSIVDVEIVCDFKDEVSNGEDLREKSFVLVDLEGN